MSYFKIENFIHSMRISASDLYSDNENMYASWACDSLEWYVMTARSSLNFDRSLLKANPAKLLRYAVKFSSDHSTSGDIKAFKKYLSMHCGYREYDY